MKILQTNFFNYQDKKYQITPYRNQYVVKNDAFVRSNAPSFKGEDEVDNQFQQILQSPSMSKKFIELISNAAAFIVAKAGGDYKGADSELNVSEDKVKIIIERDNSNKLEKEEIAQLKRDVAQMKEENRLLKLMLSRYDLKPEQINSTDSPLPKENNIQPNDEKPIIKIENDETGAISEVVIPEENEVETSSQDNVSEAQTISQEVSTDNPEGNQSSYKFVFPKKNAGLYSKTQKELRMVTSNLKLDETYGQKLTDVCKELMTGKECKVDGKTLDKKELTVKLADQLGHCSDDEVEDIIDEYHKELGLSREKVEEQPKEDSADETVQTSDETSQTQAPADIYRPEPVVLKGVTVKGKINLDDIKDRKKSNTNVTPESSKTKGKKRPRINNKHEVQHVDITSDTDDQLAQLRIINPNSKASIFTIGGTVDPDVKNNLKKLLIYFENSVVHDTPNSKFKCGKTLGLNLEGKDIMQEVRAQLKRDPDNAYKHINEFYADDVAEAINSEPILNDMFSIHAAMRIIDRFVDFNSDRSIQDQCHDIIISMTNVLQKSFKEGLEVRRYKDTDGYIGARVIVPPSAYDDQARKIFGVQPFAIGLSENQPQLPYYNKKLREPLICTIFEKGI